MDLHLVPVNSFRLVKLGVLSKTCLRIACTWHFQQQSGNVTNDFWLLNFCVYYTLSQLWPLIPAFPKCFELSFFVSLLFCLRDVSSNSPKSSNSNSPSYSLPFHPVYDWGEWWAHRRWCRWASLGDLPQGSRGGPRLHPSQGMQQTLDTERNTE